MVVGCSKLPVPDALMHPVDRVPSPSPSASTASDSGAGAGSAVDGRGSRGSPRGSGEDAYPRDYAFEHLERKSNRLVGTVAHKLSHAAGGSIAYHTVAGGFNLKKGPASGRAFGNWPFNITEALFTGEGGGTRKARYLNMMMNGHVMSTDFSGQCSAEMAIKMQEVAFQTGGVALPHCTSFYRTSDTSKLCQKVIKACSHPYHGPHHLFDSVSDCLPDEVGQEIENLRPAVDKNNVPIDPQYAAQRHGKMKALLRHVGPHIFQSGRWAKCLIHNKVCRFDMPMPARPCNMEQRPLMSVMAGPICLPWTSFGPKNGPAHPANESYLVWGEHIKHAGYDLASLENSEYFPVRSLSEHMSDTHLTISMALCPTLMGWPLRRHRTLATCINLRSLIWLGPIDKESISDDFMKFFGRHVQVEADVFAHLDSIQNHDDNVRSLAGSRGKYGDKVTTWDTLPPDAKHRLLAYQDMIGQHTGLAGTCVGDLSQNPAKRKRIGPWLPAFARTTIACSFTAGGPPEFPYLFTPREVAFAHGWPSLQRVDGELSPFHFLYPSIFDELTRAESTSLLGNSMSLPVIAAWWCYIVSNCMPRHHVGAWMPVREAQLCSLLRQRWAEVEQDGEESAETESCDHDDEYFAANILVADNNEGLEDLEDEAQHGATRRDLVDTDIGEASGPRDGDSASGESPGGIKSEFSVEADQ